MRPYIQPSRHPTSSAALAVAALLVVWHIGCGPPDPTEDAESDAAATAGSDATGEEGGAGAPTTPAPDDGIPGLLQAAADAPQTSAAGLLLPVAIWETAGDTEWAGPVGAPAAAWQPARYALDIEFNWSSETHPFNFPFDAHFSWFAGAVHDAEIRVWSEGLLATPGAVRMAEIGDTDFLTLEAAAATNSGALLGPVEWRWWVCPPETTNEKCGPRRLEFEAVSPYPYLSLMSMLGPSPDWFVGLESYPLVDDGGWIDGIVEPLSAYDAGTRSDNIWQLFGPEHDPPVPISAVTEESGQLVGTAPLATARFELLTPEKQAPFFAVDGGNHRVLALDWPGGDQPPTTAFALGQPDLSSVSPSSGSTGLSEPTDVATDGERLLVADTANHRVLVWDALPTGSGAPATAALGQPSLDGGQPATGPQGMKRPTALHVTPSGALWVADSSNHRVLGWDQVPTSSGAPADRVVGQLDFDANAPGTSLWLMRRPQGVWADESRLVVADTENHRVLIWYMNNGQPAANASTLIGQSTDWERIAGGGSTGLNFPTGVYVDGETLYIADSGNHRIVAWGPLRPDILPAPIAVIGQSNFENVAYNDADQDGFPEASAFPGTLRSPRGLTQWGQRLFVTDSGNQRIQVFHRAGLFPEANTAFAP